MAMAMAPYYHRATFLQLMSWILALTMYDLDNVLRNFLVLDPGLSNVLRNFFVSIAICGHSDHKTDITIEFTYITLAYLPVLPYMVTPITKWTLTKSKVPLHSTKESTGSPCGLHEEWEGLEVESLWSPCGIPGIIGTPVGLQ
jgi:hypothetical protein